MQPTLMLLPRFPLAASEKQKIRIATTQYGSKLIIQPLDNDEDEGGLEPFYPSSSTTTTL
jgi:hypothetical protein